MTRSSRAARRPETRESIFRSEIFEVDRLPAVCPCLAKARAATENHIDVSGQSTLIDRRRSVRGADDQVVKSVAIEVTGACHAEAGLRAIG